MGSGKQYKCNKCGYEFTSCEGVGFMFPQVYETLAEKAKSGALGEEIQAFFRDHKDGALNAESVVAYCKDCGKIADVPDLAMYIPKDGYVKKETCGIWSGAMPFEGTFYVAPWELKESYDLYEKYDHRCGECGGEMKIVDTETETLFCPKCKGELEVTGFIDWD